MREETWRPIPDFDGVYSASSLGRIRRDRAGRGARAGHILKPCGGRKDGYQFVNLHDIRAGKPRPYLVHRLVAAAFFGPAPDGYCANHLNSERTDNRVENLEWTTYSGNIQHCIRMGRFRTNPRVGSAHWAAKLSEEDVAAIRAMPHAIRRAYIARIYGISVEYVSEIRHRGGWKHARD